jgi:Zn-dependent protease
MLFQPWKLGRVAGIDLFLHPTFLLVPLYLLLQGGSALSFVVVAGVFGCVVLHELGHALMARRYGIGTHDITLYPIGGVASLDRMPRSAGPELLIALAGPAVNVALAAVFWAGLEIFGQVLYGSELGVLLYNLLWINVGLFVFNMLPVFPMDGGRVLRALLSTWLGRYRATEIAAELGRGIAIVAGIWFLLNGMTLQILLAAFIFMAASAELRAVRSEEARRHQESNWPEPPAGYRWVDRGDGVWRAAPITVTWGQHQQPGRPGPWR